MNFYRKIQQIENNFLVHKKECGKTKDLKNFAVILYQEDDEYKIWGAVDGSVEHLEICEDLEAAEHMAKMAFEMLKNNSFGETVPLQPAPAPVHTSTDATTTFAMNAILDMVKMMQTSNEKNADRLENIIYTTEKGKADLLNVMVSEQDKNRDLTREIMSQNHQQQMATTQMIADMQRNAIEANTRNQQMFLGYQKEQLAIQNNMQQRHDDERAERDQRDERYRREHEIRLEQIRQQKSKKSGGCSIM